MYIEVFVYIEVFMYIEGLVYIQRFGVATISTSDPNQTQSSKPALIILVIVAAMFQLMFKLNFASYCSSM